MAFDYYVLVDDDDRDRAVGLFAVNRDKEAGRLDAVFYDYWTLDLGLRPGAVTRFLFSLICRTTPARPAATPSRPPPTSASRCRPNRS